MAIEERGYRAMEVIVGIFISLGILAMGYISISLGKIEFLNRNEYTVYATFSNVSGLKKKAPVTMSGVEIGRVEDIVLDTNGRAKVVLKIKKDIKLSEDCIASVKTMGIIGDKYIAISQGGLDSYIQPGGTIAETLPPIDVEELFSKFVFGKIEDRDSRQKEEGKPKEERSSEE
ncbi:MAG: outer membrane lipid asymmetry maintenance protein MlaD [Syntrophobacterales bacterium]|nr:outer membrane lipid asymmetry maintenance protein MlaD [Syntrophobacterales bacterium]